MYTCDLHVNGVHKRLPQLTTLFLDDYKSAPRPTYVGWVRYSRSMMSHAVGARHVRFGTVALLAVGALLTTSCSAADEVVFEGAAPESSATSSTPQTTTSAATTTETTTVVTRATATTTEPTRSTLAVSERRIAELPGQVVINDLQTRSIAILGPESDRLELFATVGEDLSQPTWSPDGRFVAWSRATTEGYSVVVSSTAGDQGTPYETPFGVFYMQWRPDGRALGMLGASEAGRVGLAILDLDSETVTSMNSSSSYYFHWSPEGHEMITHLDGTRLEQLDPLTGDTAPLKELDPINSLFQAAAWTPDGRSILYVLPAVADLGGAQDELVIHDLETGETDVLGEGNGFFNFAVSPDGKSVAYSIQNIGVATSMQVVDLATGKAEEIDAPRTFAWQWSPDSHKILLLGVGTNNMTVSVYESGTITHYQHITPTTTFLRSYLAFWSQYDLSHSLWAPDSSAFVFAASDRNADLVFLQFLDEELPVLIGPGSMAVFSPAASR